MENKNLSLSGNDKKQIIEALLPFLNSIPNLPCKVNLEILEEKGCSICIQQLKGAQKLNVNIIGGYTGQFPFALWYRIEGKDTASRLKGTNVLNEIGSFFDSGQLPELGDGRVYNKIEMTSIPTCNNRHEDGSEDYLAIFMLEYRQKSRFE